MSSRLLIKLIAQIISNYSLISRPSYLLFRNACYRAYTAGNKIIFVVKR